METSSAVQVEIALSRLSSSFGQHDLLPSANPFKDEGCAELDRMVNKQDYPDPEELASYVAVSVPLHCADGWLYLGSALSALLRGDPAHAIHAAYYAELRAVTAVLARHGVGVFNHNHYVISQDPISQNAAVNLVSRKSTHVFAWQAFDSWTETAGSSHFLEQTVQPAGVGMDQWLYALSFASYPHARDWFDAIGFDLAHFADDRRARNTVSYRPTALHFPHSLPYDECVAYVSELWRLLSPGMGGFDTFDSHFLQHTALRASHFMGLRQHQRNARYTQALKKLSVPVQHPSALLLTGARAGGPPRPFQEAVKTSQIGSAGQELQVISRAAILLRLATGAVESLLFAAGVDWGELDFWWDRLGVRLALWAPGRRPQAIDLWMDVEEAIDEADNWIAANPSACYHDLRQAEALSLGVMCDAKRAMLWGMAG